METREITQEELERIRPYATEQDEYLWFQKHKTTPTIVHTVYGDGKQLISLDPTNTRPDYYIILADSSIKCFENALDFVADNEELIFQSIEEEYGNSDDWFDEDGGEIEDKDDLLPGEMPLNIGSGYTCGFFDKFRESEV